MKKNRKRKIVNKKIKFGARIYEISLADLKKELAGSSIQENEEIFGYVDYSESKIIVDKNMSEDAIKENLVHEILHVLIDRRNLESIYKNSSIKEVVENMVEYLTPRFHSFLEDNPEFQKDFIKFPNK